MINKLIPQLLLIFFLAYSNASAAPSREIRSGFRLTSNNKFVKTSSRVILEKGFEHLNSIIKPPNSNLY